MEKKHGIHPLGRFILHSTIEKKTGVRFTENDGKNQSNRQFSSFFPFWPLEIEINHI